MRNTIVLILVGALVAVPLANASIFDHRDAALRGADRLMAVQLDSGAMPWIVGDPGEFQNIQGITAIGLLDAYTLSLDAHYMGNETTGANGTFNWLVAYHNSAPPNLLSSANYYFMAKFGLLQLDLFGQGDALATAREAFERLMAARGGASAYGELILESRKAQGHTNLGLWDVALFARAAQDIGNTTAADAFAAVLVEQVTDRTIVDPFDAAANWYEIGLAGLLFGLAEADVAAHAVDLADIARHLGTAQCADGSFPTTFGGETECGGIQATAYPVIGLLYAFQRVPEAQAGCDFLAANQAPNGGWLEGDTEFAEADAEAVSALTQCALLLHNGATAYANAVVPGI